MNKIEKTKTKSIVSIREEDCIGCAKCIEVCPVDAILGSPKLMHTVIADECIGCDLRIPPCPVDCIEHVPMDQPRDTAHTRKRVSARRLRIKEQQKSKKYTFESNPKDYINKLINKIDH